MIYKQSFVNTMTKHLSIKHNAVCTFDTFSIEINVFGITTTDLNQYLTNFCLKYKQSSLLYIRIMNILLIFNTVYHKD